MAYPVILAAGENENVLLPPLSELLVGILAFGLLVAFFFWQIYPNIKRVYAERSERIEGGLARAEKAQQEARATLDQYRSQLAEARADAARIREEAREQGRQILEELRAQARQEAAEIKARADEQLAADRAATVAQLRREVGEIAVQLAARVVGHELERDKRQRQLVDDFIAGLEEEATPTAGGAPPLPAPAAPRGSRG